MSHDCCEAPQPAADGRYRRILWIALWAKIREKLRERPGTTAR